MAYKREALNLFHACFHQVIIGTQFQNVILSLKILLLFSNNNRSVGSNTTHNQTHVRLS